MLADCRNIGECPACCAYSLHGTYFVGLPRRDCRVHLSQGARIRMTASKNRRDPKVWLWIFELNRIWTVDVYIDFS